MVKNFKKTLYGIGVGPGDPDLITVKAVRIIGSSPLLFAPRASIASESLALRILSKHIPSGIVCRELIYPMSRNEDELRNYWEQAGREIVEALQHYDSASFITLGDPSLYSTWCYTRQAVQHLDPTINIQVVPGINSASISAAVGGIDLAAGSEKTCVLPTPTEPEELDPYIDMFDSITLMKTGGRLGKLLDYLTDRGLQDYSFFISRASQEEEWKFRGVPGEEELPESYMFTVVLYNLAEYRRASEGEKE